MAPSFLLSYSVRSWIMQSWFNRPQPAREEPRSDSPSLGKYHPPDPFAAVLFRELKGMLSWKNRQKTQPPRVRANIVDVACMRRQNKAVIPRMRGSATIFTERDGNEPSSASMEAILTVVKWELSLPPKSGGDRSSRFIFTCIRARSSSNLFLAPGNIPEAHTCARQQQ